MKHPMVQITLKHRPTECLGKPYEVVRFKNAVVVRLEQPGQPRKDLRVGDRIDELDAEALVAGNEVNVIPQ